MKKSLHLASCCLLYCVLQCIGCQMGNGEGPITTTLGFRDVPKQSEPPIETEDEIESQEVDSAQNE